MTHVSQQTNDFQKDAAKKNWRSHVAEFVADERGAFTTAASGVAMAVGQAGVEIHPFKVTSMTQALGL